MKYLLITLFLCFAVSCSRSGDEIISNITSTTGTPVDGIGIVIVVDCSGSMSQSVDDTTGRDSKINIAKRSVMTIVKQAQSFAQRNNANVKVAIIKFSDSNSVIMPFQTPDTGVAQPIVDTLSTGNGTAIGDAVTDACKELNTSGFTSKHIIVVTDGENTSGTEPSLVAETFKKLPPTSQPKVYVVAFDVDAAVFKSVIQSGWMVLPAKDGQQLQTALNTIVSGDILLEK